MSFQKDKINDFRGIFDQSSQYIRNFPGCSYVKLLQDADYSHIFCTYSCWVDETALENYRHSLFFKEVWSQTKGLFADKLLVFSLNRVEE